MMSSTYLQYPGGDDDCSRPTACPGEERCCDGSSSSQLPSSCHANRCWSMTSRYAFKVINSIKLSISIGRGVKKCCAPRKCNRESRRWVQFFLYRSWSDWFGRNSSKDSQTSLPSKARAFFFYNAILIFVAIIDGASERESAFYSLVQSIHDHDFCLPVMTNQNRGKIRCVRWHYLVRMSARMKRTAGRDECILYISKKNPAS